MSQPLAIDLYSGLHGWAEALVWEGWRVIAFDIVDMCKDLGHERMAGIELVLQDVLTLHGSQFREAGLIVASPPCQEPSYRAMPWSRAKALNAAGPPHKFIALFDACFRIQREASESAGRYIPLIVENVRGAQKWVGRANANFGSYYLWGNVGMVGQRVVAGVPRFGVSVQPIKAHKVPGFRFDGNGGSFQTASVEATGNKHPAGNCAPVMWKDREITRYSHPTLDEGMKVMAHLNIRDGHSHTRHLTNQREHIKVPGIKLSEIGFNVAAARNIDVRNKPEQFKQTADMKRQHIGYSRKAASAQIAKIPFPLAQYIARCFKPEALTSKPEQSGRDPTETSYEK